MVNLHFLGEFHDELAMHDQIVHAEIFLKYSFMTSFHHTE